ncbi:heavy-metal-associated domain-containing protein [Saccharopolyspora taberi]|uniref:Heavy-metal-associated domain-containing protein n=1 Tax=Saccharopolyspora taberi TaxID=60895 RepID=A0ABN3V6N6_9PSEU
MTTTSYLVKGMTCDHCAQSVRSEVGGLAGVQRVDVDLPTGTVTVTSQNALADAEIAAAVDEAGYEVVSRA